VHGRGAHFETNHVCEYDGKLQVMSPTHQKQGFGLLETLRVLVDRGLLMVAVEAVGWCFAVDELLVWPRLGWHYCGAS
jgi:hypothetical protein